ncbi:hypothetical protein LOC67_12485 [Stieleria sp. JC731]|uniref:hypothetical protein n=1 Tax=Pirellulaceae TaxID=2691357 RepID=UPI001E636576|nr:hypothetical protein [Stieleria sp. JC731]MCC9601364.1 hypothetical protein [Stieleria sp. JC731]
MMQGPVKSATDVSKDHVEQAYMKSRLAELATRVDQQGKAVEASYQVVKQTWTARRGRHQNA